MLTNLFILILTSISEKAPRPLPTHFYSPTPSHSALFPRLGPTPERERCNTAN